MLVWSINGGAVLEKGITAPTTGLISIFIFVFAGTGSTLKAISTCSFSLTMVTVVVPLSFT